MDLVLLLLLGMISTSYPEVYEIVGSPMVRLMEKRLDSPHVKTYSNLLGDVGVELNSLGLCLFPAFILKQKNGFDMFFEENDIQDCR